MGGMKNIQHVMISHLFSKTFQMHGHGLELKLYFFVISFCHQHLLSHSLYSIITWSITRELLSFQDFSLSFGCTTWQPVSEFFLNTSVNERRRICFSLPANSTVDNKPLTRLLFWGSEESRRHAGKCSETAPYCAATARVQTVIDDRENRSPKQRKNQRSRKDK